MLNFDENRVRTEHQNGVNLIPEVEKIVDQVCQEGYSNIFCLELEEPFYMQGRLCIRQNN